MCVLGSTFKDQAVFKAASFASCWVFSDLPVCACRIPVIWGYVRAWLLLGLHFPFRVPSPSQLASIWGSLVSYGSPAHMYCLLVRIVWSTLVLSSEYVNLPSPSVTLSFLSKVSLLISRYSSGLWFSSNLRLQEPQEFVFWVCGFSALCCK